MNCGNSLGPILSGSNISHNMAIFHVSTQAWQPHHLKSLPVLWCCTISKVVGCDNAGWGHA